MRKKLLLMAVAFGLALSAGAQQKVQKYFRVSDGAFNVANWQDENNPNSANASQNSFTIPTAFGSVAWNWGYWWTSDGTLDISKYDKLVIRLSSVVGNNLQFRIFSWNADGNTMEYDMPDDVVEFDEETEYEIDLTEDLYCANEAHLGEPLDKEHVLSFTFWNYWSTSPMLDENGDPMYDDEGNVIADDDPSVTVTISAMYLERTLANGEKDYLDLLADNSFSFSDDFLNDDDDDATSGSYIDNAGTLHVNENATTGIYFEDEPADWSAYRYLVVVPQMPYVDGVSSTVDYNLTDIDDNVFASGSFRYGYFNRPRAAVLDLDNILNLNLGDTSDDAPERLEEFDTSSIFSFHYSLWGGVSTWEYGVAGLFLSNTQPTYSTGFGDSTDQTGDYVRDNAAENTISTVVLPYAAACCGAQVYEVAGVDSKSDPSEVYCAPHYGILEAGKPYILRTNSDKNVTFFRAGCNEEASPKANGALTANSFPTYYVEADKNYCVLNASGDTFEAVTGRSTRVNSNTAYLSFNDMEEAEEVENGLVLYITGVDPANGVAKVTVERDAMKDNKYYDMTGRVVPQPTKKGIYIHNGKKIVLK